MNYSIGSTMGVGIYSDSNGTDGYGTIPMSMCVSSEAPMMWMSTSWPNANIRVRDPKPLERVCKWCGAMFNSSKFYPGNCICCGGPRGE